MNLNPMPIGARVTIRQSSEYYGIHPEINPANEVGIVEEIREGERYIVRWVHSDMTNGYDRIDLKYWRGQVPKKEPEPAINPDNIPALIEKAIADCKKQHQNVTARYAFVYNNGSVVVSGNTACHNSVMSMGGGEKTTVVSIVTCINGNTSQNSLTEEQSLKFYDWLLNRSPYAEAFVSKDANKTFKEDRYAVMNVSSPANMLQGALVTSRQPWEHWNVVRVFCKLVDKGIDENTAYLFGSMFRESTDKSLTVSLQSGGHFNLDIVNMSVKDCLAFVENKPHVLTNPFNKGGECMCVHDMFCKEGKSEVGRYARDLVKKAGAKKGFLQTNPFAAAKRTDTKEVDYDDLASYVKTNGVFV